MPKKLTTQNLTPLYQPINLQLGMDKITVRHEEVLCQKAHLKLEQAEPLSRPAYKKYQSVADLREGPGMDEKRRND